MTPKRVVAFIVGSSAFSLILLPWAAAKSPADLLNGGDPHESLGRSRRKGADRGVTYAPTTFALPIRIRPRDERWMACSYKRPVQVCTARPSQDRERAFSRTRIDHARGEHPCHSFRRQDDQASACDSTHAGECDRVRAGPPGSMAWRSTRRSRVPIRQHRDLIDPVHDPAPLRLLRGQAESRGVGQPISGKGQLLRIMAIDVHGKIVMVFLESDFPQPGYPAEKTFPTFVPYAEQLLATLQFP